VIESILYMMDNFGVYRPASVPSGQSDGRWKTRAGAMMTVSVHRLIHICALIDFNGEESMYSEWEAV